ncbi:MAG: tryptophan synthase subunit alpha [Nitrososphaerales archaeon]|nr:tryptophan synthase subunit alpha [Nitrososphaerales archaeon]
MAYVMGGDPDLRVSRRVIDAVVDGGADILEIGIPFSDPIADGKSIQAAGTRALSSGTRPRDVLDLAGDVKSRRGIPVALMTYYNIVHSVGVEKFLDQARKRRVDAVIVPDLPLDEAGTLSSRARKRGIDTILMAAPTTSSQRMRDVVKNTSGFLYLVSLLGVTGARSELKSDTVRLVKFAEKFTHGRVPLAVGFGLSKPEHVAGVLECGADAAIVGSGIVDRVSRHGRGTEAMARDVERYVRSLKDATRASRGS